MILRILKLVILLAVSLGCQKSGKDEASVGTTESGADSTIATTPQMDSSGLIVDQHYLLVKSQCTGCHSAQLITQNQASREGWEQMIRWMQETQGLWDLGEHEPLILDYLSHNYGLQRKGRRLPLEDIEWYQLKD